MIVRLRSRDGLERIEVDNNATLAALKHAIHTKLNIPLHDMHLSKNPALLTSKTPQDIRDLVADAATLASMGVQHGDQLFMLYSFERQVEPVYKKSVLESRPFGSKITIDDVMAKQTRIERQEKAKVDSVSFDRHAADVFQSYVSRALSFNIKRGGIMYGVVEEGKVLVEFIYEPPQDADAMNLKLHRGSDEEAQVDFLANLLGYQKLGWVFSQSKAEREFIMHTQELLQTAEIQDEMGETSVTVTVTWDDNEEGGHVHFEAFQCSEQCVKMAKEGWMVVGDKPSGVTTMRSPKDPTIKEAVIVAGKDAAEVDNDYFLVPIPILQHEGKLLTSFPVENRLLPQGKAELRDHLRRNAARSYVERISDLHLLLWLSKQPNLDANDMLLLCDAVKGQKPVGEGYRMIIDSIAGIQP